MFIYEMDIKYFIRKEQDMFMRREFHLPTYKVVSLLIIFIISLSIFGMSRVQAEEYLNPIEKALNTGNPVVVDFGRDMCIPCVKMKPILEELKKEYKGKIEFVIINIDDFPSLAKNYRIMLIPTQIFFDSEGKEIYRHVGFMSKKDIKNKLGEIVGGDFWKQY